MSANEFGHLFKMISFGESHGPAMGVVIDGCPAGLVFDEELLQHELDRRKPGTSTLVSARKENDRAEVLSGVFQGKTLGTPIAIQVKNRDAKSEDYETIQKKPRTGHADQVWKEKFKHYDHRGGGRSSGRETISRVMAGAVAQMFVQNQCPDLKLQVFPTQIGPLKLTDADFAALGEDQLTQQALDQLPARFPIRDTDRTEKLLSSAKSEGKSYGGVVRIKISGVPKGLGQPIFYKLKSELARGLMSLGAVSAVELGDGVTAVEAEGSDYHSQVGDQYGGIQGGISTGRPILFNCYFKPTSSVMDVAKKGRHDPCIVPRAIPVLEAMTYLILADQLLWQRLDVV